MEHNSSNYSSAYPEQQTWRSILSEKSDKNHKNEVNQKITVPPSAFKKSVKLVQEWLDHYIDDVVLSLNESSFCEHSSFSDVLDANKTVYSVSSVGKHLRNDGIRQKETDRAPENCGVACAVRISKTPKKAVRKTLKIPTQIKTPHKKARKMAAMPKTPMRQRAKTPLKHEPTSSAPRICKEQSESYVQADHLVKLGDMLFQLTLMEEALRTNPESLGISSPHTARVLAKTVDSREKELVGILKSRMSEPSKLRKEVERIKAEEAALIQQKRELFLAETRKVDHMERKVYSTKVRNIMHDVKAHSIKSKKLVGELERLSLARSAREVHRSNMNAASEIRKTLSCQVTEVREQLAEERKKDEATINDLIKKLTWARESKITTECGLKGKTFSICG
ncbi:uncharacterized protein LOC136042452 [Artemia franciscana]|uniref:uncharacterized protein LOC136042452 n=1 Tax=Artemia franciscana TaxID=6661 RepID=UPI0032DA5090